MKYHGTEACFSLKAFECYLSVSRKDNEYDSHCGAEGHQQEKTHTVHYIQMSAIWRKNYCEDEHL